MVESLDKLYPEFSSYSFALNSPVQFKDIGGEGVNGGFSVTNQSVEPIVIVGTSYTVISQTWDDTESEGSSTKITLQPSQRFKATVVEVKDKNNKVIGKKFTGYVEQYADFVNGNLVNRDVKDIKTVNSDANVWDVDYIEIQPD